MRQREGERNERKAVTEALTWVEGSGKPELTSPPSSNFYRIRERSTRNTSQMSVCENIPFHKAVTILKTKAGRQFYI